jgi:hypothetical protein
MTAMPSRRTALFVIVSALCLFLAPLALAETPTPEKPMHPNAVELRAGPIRLKFQDGDLRYLKVGDKEIVRRVYFGVRDGNWNTAMPRFTRMDVDRQADHFTITLAAECDRGPTRYRWTGKITGSPDGRIEYEAEGAPDADFKSNRIGLCVLFGTMSLVGQNFDTDGQTGKSTFPELVSPDLVAKKFHTLSYTAPHDLKVKVALEGAVFDMEDQRNWGDTSFKAYAPLPYKYPDATKGQTLKQKVTITAQASSNAGEPDHHAAGPTVLRVRDAAGSTKNEAKIPTLVARDAFARARGFVDINTHRDRFQDQQEITWAYTPTTHLPDEDTMMENIPAIVYQARTIRSFAPHAKLRVGPIVLLNPEWPNRPQLAGNFTAAWTATFLKYLSEAGIDQAAFDLQADEATKVLDDLKPFAGRPMLEVDKTPHDVRVDALAAEDHGSCVLWIVNASDAATPVAVEGLGQSSKARLAALSGGGAVQAADHPIPSAGLSLSLTPYEVLRVSMGQ